MLTRQPQIYGKMRHGIFSRENSSPQQEKPRDGRGISILKMEQKCSFKFDERHGWFFRTLRGGGSLDVHYMSSISDAAVGAACAAVRHAASFLNTCREATERRGSSGAASFVVVLIAIRSHCANVQTAAARCLSLPKNLVEYFKRARLVSKCFRAAEIQEHRCPVSLTGC